ncbi:hypothetical protein CBL_07801 [Carabus blaptoides fortunei]
MSSRQPAQLTCSTDRSNRSTSEQDSTCPLVGNGRSLERYVPIRSKDACARTNHVPRPTYQSHESSAPPYQVCACASHSADSALCPHHCCAVQVADVQSTD